MGKIRKQKVAKSSDTRRSRAYTFMANKVLKFYSNKAIKDINKVNKQITGSSYAVQETQSVLFKGVWRPVLFSHLTLILYGIIFASIVYGSIAAIQQKPFLTFFVVYIVSELLSLVTNFYSKNFPATADQYAIVDAEIEMTVREQVQDWAYANEVHMDIMLASEIASRTVTKKMQELDNFNDGKSVLLTEALPNGTIVHAIIHNVPSY